MGKAHEVIAFDLNSHRYTVRIRKLHDKCLNRGSTSSRSVVGEYTRVALFVSLISFPPYKIEGVADTNSAMGRFHAGLPEIHLLFRNMVEVELPACHFRPVENSFEEFCDA
jgi:hypothetical protein